MSYKSNQNLTRGYTYHRYLTGFRGMDLAADGASVSTARFADMENMWSPDGEAVLETFPGFRSCHVFDGRIYGIYAHHTAAGDYLAVHSGTSLYRFPKTLCNRPRALKNLQPLYDRLPSEKGVSFAVGECLYLLIGAGFYRIDAQGVFAVVGQGDALPYIPLTHQNGKPYEQKNLLTSKIRHRYTVDALNTYVETDGFAFTVISRENKTCSVKAGVTQQQATALRIPSHAVINGETYTVVRIEQGGFQDILTLVSVTLPDTLIDIMPYAFSGCTALSKITLPYTVERLYQGCFSYCMLLGEVTLPHSLRYLHTSAFQHCLSLSDVYYPKDNAAYQAVSKSSTDDPFGEAVFHTESSGTEDTAAVLICPMYDKCTSIESVKIGDTALSQSYIILSGAGVRYTTVMKDGYIDAIHLITTDILPLQDKQLTVLADTVPAVFCNASGVEQNGFDAICGCRLATSYDGRIFFSGNPCFPSTVFYSLPDESGYNHPLYVGTLSYFNDGLSDAPNTALLGTGSMLMVLKGDTHTEGALYYHTPLATGEDLVPRIYPAVSGAAGIGCVGGAINFRDDPVFLSQSGLLSVGHASYQSERNLVHRSSRIDLRLCAEPLEKAVMAVHKRCLYILVDGRVYIADSRRMSSTADGHNEYEWYFLRGIGSYTNDSPLYRYAAVLPTGAEEAGIRLSPFPEESVTGEVFSVASDAGMLYYVQEGDERYAVDHDGEYRGGTFCPADCLCEAGGSLFFGTPDGSLCCFNTDRRGVTVYHTVKSDLYRKTESGYALLDGKVGTVVGEDALEHMTLYEKQSGIYINVGTYAVYTDGLSYAAAVPIGEDCPSDKTDAYWYSFGNHAFVSGCVCCLDNGDVPHLSKNTVPRSVTLRIKNDASSLFYVLVRTDRTSWHKTDVCATAHADFGSMDFGAFDFHSAPCATLSLREREKHWCTKQYRFHADVFRRPFGIYEIAYAYRIAGRVRSD